MALVNRIESLKKRHAEIDMRLHDEISHPSQDEKLIRQLKCLKLSLKDEINRLLTGDEQREAA